MKIEKLNEQQIRCTLTKEDLAVRHIKLSELAYGSDKTRQLFQDMMDQASSDLGFEVDDIPLMVEAIPMSPEQIVLIITKVESPDELDTRFSEFSQYQETEEVYPEEVEEEPQGGLNLPEDILGLLREIRRELADANECPALAEERVKTEEAVCVFAFQDMDTAIPAAQAVAQAFRGPSALYREDASGEYLLFLHQGSHSPMEFSRVCRTMTAYVKPRKYTPGMEAYCREHGRVILAADALQTLAVI